MSLSLSLKWGYIGEYRRFRDQGLGSKLLEGASRGNYTCYRAPASAGGARSDRGGGEGGRGGMVGLHHGATSERGAVLNALRMDSLGELEGEA